MDLSTREYGRKWSALMGLLVAALALTVGCGPDYPACEDDEDCHENEYCVNDQCQQCRDDSHCPSGQRCNSGRCDPIEGYCNGNGDCPDGQECDGNRCVATQTTEMPDPVTETGPTGCTLNTVYFGFDSDDLDSSTRDGVATNARCIQQRNISRVHVTGYTDPRGTEEYNLALGDRRARAVMQYMVSLGVDRGAVSASSVGEEMSSGTDEASYRNDRKVTFTEQ
jgi:peptidoglycan-associated lipoprotein